MLSYFKKKIYFVVRVVLVVGETRVVDLIVVKIGLFVEKIGLFVVGIGLFVVVTLNDFPT